MSILSKLWQTVAGTAPPVMKGTPILGLDLGQAKDYTALCGLEQFAQADGVHEYACRYLKRFELGTPYTTIANEVIRIVRQFPASASLAVDMTGVGRPVVDMLRAGLPVPIWPITITAGVHSTQDEDGWKVPKRELVSVIQLLLQSKRLAISKQLPDAAVLGKELATFEVKITAAGTETFSAWREGANDDLVLATALAAWVGEYVAVAGECRVGGKSAISEMPAGVWLADRVDPDAADWRHFGGKAPESGSSVWPSNW
jgi:hypothetical protein